MESGDVPPIRGERWPVIVGLLGLRPATLLDVGCRGRELEPHLPAGVRYVGMDIVEPADVIASAEDPFPFGAGEFDAVVLADVLEHLENPHGALDEAMRVATGSVVVLLPNLYTLALRMRFLAGATMGKYEFGATRPEDRHRWLMNFDQARTFTRHRAAENGWRVAQEGGYVYPFRRRRVAAVYDLARRLASPNLWAWEYAARLEPARVSPA